MVYVSTPSLTVSSRQTVMQTQAELQRDQNELNSGKLADIGLGLGSASGRYVSLEAEQGQLKAITDSNALTSTRLSASAAALKSLQTAASSFLASLTTASSAGSDTTALQVTAGSNLQALIASLNTAVNGQYVFGGINSGNPPMTGYTTSPASANKAAVDDAFSTAFGTAQTSAGAATISGSDMQDFLNGSFGSLFSGTSYAGTWSQASDQPISTRVSPEETLDTSVSANESAFRQLTQAYTMVSEFTGSTVGSQARSAVLASATTLVSQALTGLTAVQANVGTTQSAVSGANDRMSAQIDLLTTETDGQSGVDSYALTTRVSALQTQIEASYELTAQLQKLSLINYL